MKFNLNFKYFAFFCYIVFSEVKCAETNRPKTQLNILRDVPSKVDLNTYLNSLEKVLNFCSKYKNEIDINFEFGLFLVDGKKLCLSYLLMYLLENLFVR